MTEILSALLWAPCIFLWGAAWTGRVLGVRTSSTLAGRRVGVRQNTSRLCSALWWLEQRQEEGTLMVSSEQAGRRAAGSGLRKGTVPGRPAGSVSQARAGPPAMGVLMQSQVPAAAAAPVDVVRCPALALAAPANLCEDQDLHSCPARPEVSSGCGRKAVGKCTEPPDRGSGCRRLSQPECVPTW